MTTGEVSMQLVIYQPNDRIQLADIPAECTFATDSSVGFRLGRPGEEAVEIGWFDAHIVRKIVREEVYQKIYLRLCIEAPLSTPRRIEQMRRDIYAALGLPGSTLYEMKVLSTTKSVLWIDGREHLSGSDLTVDEDAPMLD